MEFNWKASFSNGVIKWTSARLPSTENKQQQQEEEERRFAPLHNRPRFHCKCLGFSLFGRAMGTWRRSGKGLHRWWTRYNEREESVTWTIDRRKKRSNLPNFTLLNAGDTKSSSPMAPFYNETNSFHKRKELPPQNATNSHADICICCDWKLQEERQVCFLFWRHSFFPFVLSIKPVISCKGFPSIGVQLTGNGVRMCVEFFVLYTS